ncbi:hypothetical protein [Streptomyces sp. NPDC058240]
MSSCTASVMMRAAPGGVEDVAAPDDPALADIVAQQTGRDAGVR